MASETIRIFVCGDVMTGRGIDQILSHPGKPDLHEAWVKDARDYVRLAEMKNGAIPLGVNGSYLWERIAVEWQQRQPLVKIINLETAITRSDSHWSGKGINYRMHPRNIDALSSAQFDVCALANNHVLDWNAEGLVETLATLEAAHISVAGAGLSLERARAPAVVELPGERRVLVFAMATTSSGVPFGWAATNARPGIWLLPDLGEQTLAQVRNTINSYRQPGDLVIASIHWGGNWGYDIPRAHREFAHGLCDKAGVHLIHGHSSHHPLPLEIYKQKPVLYGCGDFINDYEGISGHEAFRGDLSLMYFLEFDARKLDLLHMELVPVQIKHFRLQLAADADTQWMLDSINSGSLFENTHFYRKDIHTLRLDNTLG